MRERDAKPRVGIGDETLCTQQLRVEQKRFFFDLKENAQGRYLRITERSGGKSSIVVPESGWELFAQVLTEIFDKADRIEGPPEAAAPRVPDFPPEID
jgi:hypothetical protein